MFFHIRFFLIFRDFSKIKHIAPLPETLKNNIIKMSSRPTSRASNRTLTPRAESVVASVSGASDATLTGSLADVKEELRRVEEKNKALQVQVSKKK